MCIRDSPYRGNEISLYDYYQGIWTIVQVASSQQFYLTNDGTASGTNLDANSVYDVYLFNVGTVATPDLRVEYAKWADDHTPPARGNVQGILTKTGGTTNDNKRYIGVVATTSAGTTRQSLGGVLASTVTSATNPFIGIGNFYNIYKASQRFFFSSGWTGPVTSGWDVPPSYGADAVIRVVTADDSALTVFLDEYSNGAGIVYAAPGFDATDAGNNNAIANVNGGNDAGVRLPVDAFYAEQEGSNQTATSCWARTLGAGMHRVYYLHQHRDNNNLNEHPAHGWIVTAEV